MTLILAIVGAVSGLTGAAVSVLTYRRNRPIIVVTSQHVMRGMTDEWVEVDVRNEGRLGVEITGLGLAVCPAPQGRVQHLLDGVPRLNTRLRIRRIDRRGVRYARSSRP